MDRRSREVEVCRVGYAMNAKKLRQSNAAREHRENRDRERDRDRDRERRRRPWRGGGLGDLLVSQASDTEAEDEEDTEIVRFYPFSGAGTEGESARETERETERVFHVLIHKLTEDIEAAATSSERESARLQSLSRYLARHPRTRIVDPLSAVRIVTSRERTCDRLQAIIRRLGEEHAPFCIPNYTVLAASEGAAESERESLTSQATEERRNAELLRELKEKHISFPVICKRIEACGTPQSHSMVVVVGEQDLHMIPRPCVVQQYHDHRGRFFKVYVIDRDVMVHSRPSLPDLCPSHPHTRTPPGCVPVSVCASARTLSSLPSPSVRSVAFDSRYDYPTLRDFVRDDAACARSLESDVSVEGTQSEEETSSKALYTFPASDCSEEEVEEMKNKSDPLGRRFFETAMAIREEFGLTLFGFDVLLPAQSSHSRSRSCSLSETERDTGAAADAEIMVVDVNYFPSYKEVPDFPSRLKKYLYRLAFAGDNK